MGIMSGPEAIQFSYKGTSFQIVQAKEIEPQLVINGIKYSVLGEKEKLAEAIEALKSLGQIGSIEDLKGKLKASKEFNLHEAQRIDEVGTKTIVPKDRGEHARGIDRIAGYVDYLKKSDFFSGIVLVAIGNKIVRHEAIKPKGIVQKPFTKDTPFNIYSVGKMFTVTAIMQLAEKGIINLDVPIKEYLRDSDYHLEGADEIYRFDGLHEEDNIKSFMKSGTTIRQLLTHTSGLMEDPARFDPKQIGKSHYSNLGYQLLARIVAHATGVSFIEYVATHVLAPAGIEFRKEPKKEEQPDLFANYLPSGAATKVEDRIPAPDGNGCFWMTATDLLKFSKALFSKALSDNRLMSEKAKELALTPDPKMDNRPLGFQVGEMGKHGRWVGLPGEFSGGSSACHIVEIEGEEPITLICLSNTSQGFWIVPEMQQAYLAKQEPSNPLGVRKVIRSQFNKLMKLSRKEDFDKKIPRIIDNLPKDKDKPIPDNIAHILLELESNGRDDLIDAVLKNIDSSLIPKIQEVLSIRGSTVALEKSKTAQRDRITSGTVARVMKASPSSDPQMEVEEACEAFATDLQKFASENLKEGALLVQILGVKGFEKPFLLGKRSVNDVSPIPVDEHMVGRTGSGAKLWAALLTKIVTKKYEKYIKMDDELGKFAPQEALRKFGRLGPDGEVIVAPELGKIITFGGVIGMNAGLVYEDQFPKKDTGTTLDQVMRGKEVRDGSIQILFHPKDKITMYSNYICLAAYPIEKAYKKVLAEENIQNMNKTVGETNKGKELPLEVQRLSIGELLKCNEAYIKGAYVYDLIDMFLHDLDPPLDNYTYAMILKKELFNPMGMTHSGFHDTPGVAMDLTYEEDPKTKKDASKPSEKGHAALNAMSFGTTSLSDAAKLAKGLSDKRGLIGEDGNLILSPNDLDDVFTPHGHLKTWGLGGVELSGGGKIIDKGGWVNQDKYSFLVDRGSGIGMIVMCNCGRRPDELIDAFKGKIEKINYPNEKPIIKAKEGTELGIPIEYYFKHPLKQEDVKQLFDGTRGRIALLFDYDKVKKGEKGFIHWSGAPLEVVKQENGTLKVTTPGRFKDLVIERLQGKVSGKDYLAVGDTAFIEIDVDSLPSPKSIENAQMEFEKIRGTYKNAKYPEYGIYQFDILKDQNGNIVLGACEVGQSKLVPQSIIKAGPTSILFNGHDRNPPDKIFRFVRDSEDDPWRLQVLDYASRLIIEERPKSKS